MVVVIFEPMDCVFSVTKTQSVNVFFSFRIIYNYKIQENSSALLKSIESKKKLLYNIVSDFFLYYKQLHFSLRNEHIYIYVHL